MAMDNFLEEVATKRNRGAETVMYVLANIMMVVFGLWAFLMLQGIMMLINAGEGAGPIIYYVVMTLLTGGIAVLLFLRRDRIRTEYEYTFTNGQMDFAQVFNNKKRKNLGTMNLKNVEALGLVNSGSFNRYINMKGIKRDNWFVNRDAQLFYFYFSKDSVKRIIIIEVSDEMLALIKRYAAPGFKGVHCNAQLNAGQVRRICRMTPGAEQLLRSSYDALGLSARAHDRILRVARTVADLAGKPLLDEDSLLEALQYRAQEKLDG